MADSILHFAAGLAVGTAAFLPALVRRLKAGAATSAFFARWFAVAFGLAVLAIAPGLLVRAGMPEHFLTAWWMNIFVLFPVIESIERGGLIVGTACVLACAGVLYLSLLLAIARQRRKRGGGA